MKNAAECARRLKRLVGKMKKERGVALPPPVDDPTDQLLRGVLTDFSSEGRANAALHRLRDAVVDLNELRVTPVAEIVEIIGADFPMCRSAAEGISTALNAVYNRLHSVDLGFLKKAARRTAESFLNSLPGLNPHAKASVLMRCLKIHAVPADAAMCEFLRRSGCVPPDARAEEIQRFLASQIRESQAPAFYAQFKRYASTHTPRKGASPPVVAPAATAPPQAARQVASETKATTAARRPAASSRSSTARSKPKSRSTGKRSAKRIGARPRRHR